MVCAFFIIFVSAKSFSFQLIIFSFKFMYIDTHSHIYEEEFREDREAVVQRAREAGVNYIVLPDIDSESRNRMLDLAARHPEMLFPLAGLHPTSVYENYKTELAQVEKALGNHTFYGIGECGRRSDYRSRWVCCFLLQTGNTLCEYTDDTSGSDRCVGGRKDRL
jgi:hypothetical protein